MLDYNEIEEIIEMTMDPANYDQYPSIDDLFSMLDESEINYNTEISRGFYEISCYDSKNAHYKIEASYDENTGELENVEYFRAR